MPRVLTSTVLTESAKEHLRVLDLVKVVFPQPIGTLYWANSYFEYKGNTYLPRINSISAWSRTMNPETDDVTLTLGNVDGLITRIRNTVTMELAEVSLIRYYVDIDEAIDPFWVGWGGTVKLDEENATWKVHFGFRGSTQKGLRKITSNCWKIFGDDKYCPYDGVDIGRSSTLSSAITDLITTTISITDPSLYFKNDVIQIDDEKFLITIVGSPTTVTRAYSGTIASTHSNGARIYHKSCGKSVQACRRRGMNGPPEIENGLRYFGGWINYLPDPFWQRGTPPPGSVGVVGIPGLSFFQQSAVGGPSVQGRIIPAVYGEFRLSNVQAVFTADAREFRHSLFLLCEGEIYAVAVNTIRSQDKEIDNCPNGYDPYPSEYDLFHNESCMIWYGTIGQRQSHAAWYNVDPDQYKKNPYLINDDTTGDGPSLSDVAAIRIRIEEGGEDFSNDLPSMDVNIIGRIVRTIQGWIDDNPLLVTQYPDPIEVAVDYLCNGKFGPRWDISRVDLNSAKTCSDYCRELIFSVDESEIGVQHSRFLFNGALTDDQDVEKQLAFILDNCNGYYIPVGRKMYFGIRKAENLTDVDAEPILSDYGVARNIIRQNGKSTLDVEDTSSLDGFVNDIETVFADKAYGFQSNTLYIYSDEAQLISAEILGDNTRVDNKKQLKLVGTINKDQAIRLGTLRLRETELQRVKYTFQMSLRDSIKIAPGDVRKLISASADGNDNTRLSAASQYIRINKIEETDKFLATIEAFKHDNSIYTDA